MSNGANEAIEENLVQKMQSRLLVIEVEGLLRRETEVECGCGCERSVLLPRRVPRETLRTLLMLIFILVIRVDCLENSGWIKFSFKSDF